MTSPTTFPSNWIPTYDTCDEVSVYCPVKYTTLGYYPNLGVNIFLAIGFGLAALLTVAIGIWKRTWGFSIAVASGCFLECAGYIGRCFVSHNPWNGDAFKLQIVSIVLAPTLVCAGIYLTLKHIVEAIDRTLSRVSPRLYPIVFIPADVSCLAIQAIGGGIAAAAGVFNYELLKHGNRVIMAGVSLQVVVLVAFGLLGGDYLWRARRHFKNGGHDSSPDGASLFTDKKFRLFLIAVAGAYAAILIRCIYRIAEMAGGWANPIMQHESSFVVLESFMLLIACWLLSGFAPGLFFPQMTSSSSKRAEGAETEKRGGVESDSPGMETA
ncbi:hypothetical protein VTJ83DRAFT_2854 [Remersonia thermophila]|uniref:Sphingoid long-chain base transporter RSB1 n=1 Tax=Remersonia thermophila TaxID=72144 RepID=A0ABR4DCE5_9PEZI